MRGRIISGSVLGAVAIGAVALFLWLDNRDAPMASAQEVVQTACDDMAKIDSYDFIASVKAEQDGVAFPDTLTVKASISGDDYQVSFSAGADSTSEGIKVGDKGYVRSTAGGNVWKVSEASSPGRYLPTQTLGRLPYLPGSEQRHMEGGGGTGRREGHGVHVRRSFRCREGCAR